MRLGGDCFGTKSMKTLKFFALLGTGSFDQQASVIELGDSRWRASDSFFEFSIAFYDI